MSLISGWWVTVTPVTGCRLEMIGFSSMFWSVGLGGLAGRISGLVSTNTGTGWLTWVMLVKGPCLVSWWTLWQGSECFFLWWMKLLESGPVQEHLSHLYGCSPVCLLLWLIRLSDLLNFLPQKSQVWPNSALCTSWCFFRECFSLNVIPQSSHAKSLMLEWTFRWTW